MAFTSRRSLADWAVEQSVRHFLEANPEALLSQVLSDAQGTLAMAGLTMTEHNRQAALDYVRLYGPDCRCPGAALTKTT